MHTKYCNVANTRKEIGSINVENCCVISYLKPQTLFPSKSAYATYQCAKI